MSELRDKMARGIAELRAQLEELRNREQQEALAEFYRDGGEKALAEAVALRAEVDGLRGKYAELLEERRQWHGESDAMAAAFAQSINIFRDRIFYLESVLRDVGARLAANGYGPHSYEIEAIMNALPQMHGES